MNETEGLPRGTTNFIAKFGKTNLEADPSAKSAFGMTPFYQTSAKFALGMTSFGQAFEPSVSLSVNRSGEKSSQANDARFSVIHSAINFAVMGVRRIPLR